MKPEEIHELATILRTRRETLNLTVREVARRAEIDVSVISRLERGQNPRPRMETLRAIGEVLGIPTADLYTTAAALPAGQLPSLRPYMRAKYRDLPDEAVAEVEQFIDELAAKHRTGGPRSHEDE